LILHNFYSFSQGNFFFLFHVFFPPFLSLCYLCFHPFVTSVSGIKIRENKLLDFASSSDIYKTAIGEFYVIYYPTISNFKKIFPKLNCPQILIKCKIICYKIFPKISIWFNGRIKRSAQKRETIQYEKYFYFYFYFIFNILPFILIIFFFSGFHNNNH